MNRTFLGNNVYTFSQTNISSTTGINLTFDAQNDPNACNGTAIGFLTGCGTKVWKLNPAAAAYEVGPSGPDDGSWWSNGTGDVPEHFRVDLWPEPNREDNVFGSKAVGEPPFMLAISVYEALRDAVASCKPWAGHVQLTAPATAEHVLDALAKQRG